MKTTFKITADDLASLVGRMRAVTDWCDKSEGFINAEGNRIRVLNVGCGFGWLEAHGIKSRWPAEFLCVEPSQKDLTTIRELVIHESLASIVASGLNLPFADESVDLIICSEVLEHIPKGTESSFYVELGRVLKVGGEILVTTPKRTVRSCLGDPAWIFGHRHYNSNDLREFASAACLNVKLIETRGGWAELCSMLDLYVSKWIFRRRPILGIRFNRRKDEEWKSPSKRNFMNLWMVLTK
jgi:SAM-dependent methyltransferase